MPTQLQKDRVALIKACELVASAQYSLDTVQRTTLPGVQAATWKKAAVRRAKGALTKAIRRACSRANDFQAESGRNY